LDNGIFIGSAALQYPAKIHDCNFISQRERFLIIVGDMNDSLASAVDLPQQGLSPAFRRLSIDDKGSSRSISPDPVSVYGQVQPVEAPRRIGWRVAVKHIGYTQAFCD